MSGWSRLWIVSCVLYGMLVAAFVWVAFPISTDQVTNEEFLREVPDQQLLLIMKSAPEIPWEDTPQTLKMDDGFTVTVRKAVTKADLEVLGRAWKQASERKLSTARREFVQTAFFFWLIPCIAIFALGIAVGWVRRGFQQGTQ